MARAGDDLERRVLAAAAEALAELRRWHERTTLPIRGLMPESLRGQRRQNVLDLLRPAHVVRQQILAGGKLAPHELSPALPDARGLEVLLDLFDDRRLREAGRISLRELRRLETARWLVEGQPGTERLLAYIDDQIAFFTRVIELAGALLRRRASPTSQ